MIDLHMHTTASDGRCTPEELVRRVAEAGIRVMSVTDHDTMASVAPAAAAARELSIELIPGIEITSTYSSKDVHVLAYFLAADIPELNALLAQQRRLRIERAREIAARLESVGAPIDVEAMLNAAQNVSGKAIARPQIAQFLIAAGHAASVADAFDRFLSEGRPAYVPHRGASPMEVVSLIAAHGGVASLAHPGQLGRDEIVPALIDAGLACIEAYHSSHDAATQAHYVALARRHGLGVTGGSDFHGDGTRRAEFFGVVNLPESDFEDLKERARNARSRSAALPA